MKSKIDEFTTIVTDAYITSVQNVGQDEGVLQIVRY